MVFVSRYLELAAFLAAKAASLKVSNFIKFLEMRIQNSNFKKTHTHTNFKRVFSGLFLCGLASGNSLFWGVLKQIPVVLRAAERGPSRSAHV